MNIAIFGAAGFIGTNLAIQLSGVPKTNLTLVDGEMGYFDTLKSLNLPNTKFVEAKFEAANLLGVQFVDDGPVIHYGYSLASEGDFDLC